VKELRIPAHWDGCMQLEYACKMVHGDEKLLVNVGKLVYQPIADTFGISRRCVESNIRRALQYAWAHGNRRRLEEVMGCTLQKTPGNAQFIAAACRYLHERNAD